MQKPTRYLLTALLTALVSACTTTPVAVKPPPTDLACDAGETTCSGDCPALPAWTTDADGKGDFDSLLALGPQDRLAMEACAAKLRACQACIQRGREAGVIQ